MHCYTNSCLLRSVTLLIAVSFLSLPTSFAASPTSRPNIIVMLADDMGWGDSRINNPESLIAMPNLEQLAEQGLNFTDAHTAATQCAPTRYTVLTGNYHWRGSRPWGVWDHFSGSQFLDGQRTLAEVLQDAGYATGIFGKLHLGSHFYLKNSDDFAAWNDDPDVDIDLSRRFVDGPLDHGFDTSYLVLSGIQRPPWAFFEDDLLVGDANELIQWEAGWYGSSNVPHDGIGMPYWDSSDVGPTLTDKAIDFIDVHHSTNLTMGTDQPFFLYYSAQAAHSPFTPPADLLGEPVAGVTGIGTHADMIYELDVTLGLLLAALENRGLADNTLIIFTSDNGGNTNSSSFGHDSMGGLRGKKGDIWEGGHRVPLVFKWGDGTPAGSMIAPGTASTQLIGIHDLVATLAALTEQSLAADQARDSYNMLPVLFGEIGDGTPVRDHLIVESPTDLATSGSGIRQKAFRQANWKLVFDENEAVAALYDLSADITETNDLSGDPTQAARISQMQSDFTALMLLDRTAPLSDIDADDVPDYLDNCVAVDNGNQRDTDGDGFGNACDADLDQNCIVNFSDLTLFSAVAFTADPDADFNGDGFVNFGDLPIFSEYFLMAPGPSGVSGLCE